MGGRLRAAAIAAGVLVALMLLASVPNAQASMTRPSWAAGDYWTYSLRSGTQNGSLTLKVLGTDTLTINGTSYPTYRVNASLTYSLGSASVTYYADTWFSSDTLALVKIRFTFTLFTTETFVVQGSPPQTIEWPLAAGNSWSSSTTVWTSAANATTTTWSKVSLTTNFVVLADQTITVPAGTFATNPLKETDATNGTYTINYWSAQVGNWARVESYSSTGTADGGFNLTAYNYQGGSFLTAVFLGLPGYLWIAILVIVLVVAVAFVLARRRRPRAPVGLPPSPPVSGTAPPPEPPMGPPGSSP